LATTVVLAPVVVAERGFEAAVGAKMRTFAGTTGQLEFDVDQTFQSEDCRQFVCAWNRWRGDKTVPDRKDIDLADIASILSQVGIIEVRSRTEAFIRLVGTSARDISGAELTGQNWINLAPPEQRQMRGERLWRLVTVPCGSWAVAASVMRSGIAVATEFAAFPVAPDDDTAMPQIMGCFRPIAEENYRRQTGDTLDNVRSEQYRFLDIGAGVPEDADALMSS
jgi:hypothetical protein